MADTTLWRHRTNLGRVVYERKPHYFSEADSKRVSMRVLDRLAGQDLGLLARWIRELSILLLARILALVGLERAAPIIYEWLLRLVSVALEQLAGDYARELAKRLYDQVVPYGAPGGITVEEIQQT